MLPPTDLDGLRLFTFSPPPAPHEGAAEAEVDAIMLAGCYGYCGLGCRSLGGCRLSVLHMKACVHACKQACLGCHAACLLADSAPNATHKEHTRRGTTGKRLASIAYADPLHRTWFEVAQTSVCCIGRVAAGLAGRSHMCNWTREGNLPPPQPTRRGGDQTFVTGPPTTQIHQQENGTGRTARTHTRSQSVPKEIMLACPGERAALMIWSVRQC